MEDKRKFGKKIQEKKKLDYLMMGTSEFRIITKIIHIQFFIFY